jgi:hypothetical protein
VPLGPLRRLGRASLGWGLGLASFLGLASLGWGLGLASSLGLASLGLMLNPLSSAWLTKRRVLSHKAAVSASRSCIDGVMKQDFGRQCFLEQSAEPKLAGCA